MVESISKSIIIEQNYLCASVLGFEDAEKYVFTEVEIILDRVDPIL